MPRGNWVSFSVRKEVYERLREFMDEEGIVSVNDAIKVLLERYALDSLFTNRVGELLKQFTDAVGELHKLTDRVGESLNKFTNPVGVSVNRVTDRVGESSRKKKRVTMLDVIRERKIQFLSEVNPRDPDKFISRAHDLGIVVLEGSRDVAFVDPSFYSGFLDRLRTVSTSNEEVVKKELGGDYYRLFVFLRENGLIYFDASEHSWKLIV